MRCRRMRARAARSGSAASTPGGMDARSRRADAGSSWAAARSTPRSDAMASERSRPLAAGGALGTGSRSSAGGATRAAGLSTVSGTSTAAGAEAGSSHDPSHDSSGSGSESTSPMASPRRGAEEPGSGTREPGSATGSCQLMSVSPGRYQPESVMISPQPSSGAAAVSGSRAGAGAGPAVRRRPGTTPRRAMSIELITGFSLPSVGRTGGVGKVGRGPDRPPSACVRWFRLPGAAGAAGAGDRAVGGVIERVGLGAGLGRQ